MLWHEEDVPLCSVGVAEEVRKIRQSHKIDGLVASVIAYPRCTISDKADGHIRLRLGLDFRPRVAERRRRE